MNLQSLKDVVSQAIDEFNHGRERVRPTWVAEMAMAIVDPEKASPVLVAFAANLEFRQLARDMLRRTFDKRDPADGEPIQHPLFPGLQAMYPVRHRLDDDDPEYVKPELLEDDDIEWNINRLRAFGNTALRHADTLEAWWRHRQTQARAYGRSADDDARPTA